MSTVLVLLILFTLIYGYHKFKQFENRFNVLEEQIKALKKDITRYLHENKPASESVDQVSRNEVSRQDARDSAEDEMNIAGPVIKNKNISEPVAENFIFEPVEIPPAPDIPAPSPVPPPQSSEFSVPLSSQKAALSSTSLVSDNTFMAEKSVLSEDKKDPAVPKFEFEPYKRSAMEEKWDEFKKNVDWEQFTGVKLFAWIGALALFIGAIFFVKYSIDNNLIPPQLRLVIGALVGLCMVVSSLIINRNRYNTTAHTMAAGGIAVLYAVSFTATIYYGFIPRMAGFGLVALISAAAFVLAVFHHGRFISVLGAIGAYATPLLIQTGHSNLVWLFIYLTVVNIGLFEVIRRTGWLPLSMLVTVGTLLTLAFGAWGTYPQAKPYLISVITLANLIVFSFFFWIYRGEHAASRSIVNSLRILFISVLLVALILIDTKNAFQYLPLLIVTVATGVAMILAYAEESWSVGFIGYAVAGFAIIGLWSYMKFDLSKPSWEMLIFFIYGVTAGLGPVFVIRKHGVDAKSLSWLKIFPVALAGLAVIIFLKQDMPSFLFWPMLMGIGMIGIFIGILVNSMLSVGILMFLLLTGGAGWIFKTPALRIGNEFFIFILLSGLLFCFLSALFLKKAADWNLLGQDQTSVESFSPSFTWSSQWVTVLPVLGPFLLLTLILLRQTPLSPNPSMAAGACFFAVAIFLARYFSSQEILTVSLTAMALTVLSWGSRLNLTPQLYLYLLGWSSILWLTAAVLPNIIFRPEKDWKIGWYAWAIFELVMACLIVFAVDRLWSREIAGWVPLGLAILKLPVIVLLLKRLEGLEERNAILAFHGGVLLFYVSSISVLLLGNSWIGVSFVIEAMLLLWLNRRIEHPGLRWVSLALAPIGLALLLFDIHALKPAHALPVLNLAVFSCTLCVLALSASVKLAGYPQKILTADFSLPEYFLWLACGTAFFLLNLIISDIFGGTGGGFKLDFYRDINQYISHTLLWTIFGALMIRIRPMPDGLKMAGLIIFLGGIIVSAFAPFYFSRQIAAMTPLFNPLLVLFVPVLAVTIYLIFFQTEDEWGGLSVRNLYITAVIVIGLIALTAESSTVFNSMAPFDFFFGHSSAMSLALILSWFLFGLGLLLWPWSLNSSFRLSGALLVLISLIRAANYPLLYAAEFGAVTPIFNVPTLIFLILLGGLSALSIKKHDQVWSFNDLIINPRYLWGALLILFAFYVTNVEVASVFGTFKSGADAGRFTFYTHGRLSQQLAYSISWLIFAIVLLSVGISRKLIHIRWVALGLLVLTALKVFIKDLWSLGQLYRVFSLIGLAVTLIFVSFIYQRYLGSTKHVKEEVHEKD